MSIEQASQEDLSSRGAACFAAAPEPCRPAGATRSIDDGGYKHVAPLELEDESNRLIQWAWGPAH